MKRVLFILILFSFALFANSIDNSIALVVNDSKIGSGVLISKDAEVLTNFHVIDGKKRVKVAFKDNATNFYEARVIKVDKKKDLALLKIENKTFLKNKKPIEFASMSKLNLDDKIYYIGHQNENLWQKSNGYIYQILKEYKWKFEDSFEHKLSYILELKIVGKEGISGAPVLTQKDLLAGLVSFDNPKKSDMVYAISIYDIKMFLKNR
ncbi:trypsin-like peptidase domain-containing protein [Halarcobacter ebronensis]|uniref:Serine protease n=1 Tax=Halarcobacter ebronensis TaxID=1462615 RepID=A0A4Q1AFS3_9BACT|nr:trypsin-like peptidase domain-containing protein [Halarcobacter ebronensis]QKF83076.1 periplasmic serine peptidase [Halarcobacter ebronensis]RXK02409.1 hypothetical protein CRV07_13775 [Halarcobacter ebronensis]